MQVTGQRDEFGVHSLAYYQDAYRHFSTAGNCVLLAATYSGRWLAALMAFRRGSQAWYFYGASSDENEIDANLFTPMGGIEWAAACGCKTYDLWGVPDAPEQIWRKTLPEIRWIMGCLSI
jgi:lipid II:glycine glycyltransferase (peptidoglycan interpeptide bridge formation enzyme)